MMNIACTVNEKFVDSLKVVLYSLKDTQTEDLDLYLIHGGLSKKSLTSLENFCKVLEIGFHEIPFPKDIRDTILTNKEAWFKKHPSFTIEVTYRLYLATLLPKDLDRCFYLDSDILVVKDLRDLYYYDLTNRPAAACPDILEYLPKESPDVQEHLKTKEILGMDKEDLYINAGIMLFNLDYIRNDPRFSKKNITQKVIDSEYDYLDQNILNEYFNKDLLRFSVNYNFTPKFYSSYDYSKVYIYHFTGDQKPQKGGIGVNGEILYKYIHAEQWVKRIEKAINSK